MLGRGTIQGRGGTKASPGGRGRGQRTGSQEADTEQQRQQQQPSPPGEIRGPEATPGVSITSGAPTHRASSLGPQGESEAVFWFQNELDQSVPWAPHPGDKGMGGLRCRGAPSSDGCRQGMLKAKLIPGVGKALRHGGGGVGSSITGCPLLRVLGPGRAQGTTSDACQLLPRPLPKTRSRWGFQCCSFHLPDNAARKLGGGVGMVKDPGSGAWGRQTSWERVCGLPLQEKPPYPSQILQVGKRKGHPILGHSFRAWSRRS